MAVGKEGIPFTALGHSTTLRLTVGALLELAQRTKRDPWKVINLAGLYTFEGDGEDRRFVGMDVLLLRDLLFTAMQPANPDVTMAEIDQIIEERRGQSEAWLGDLADLIAESFAVGGFKKPQDPKLLAEAA